MKKIIYIMQQKKFMIFMIVLMIAGYIVFNKGKNSPVNLHGKQVITSSVDSLTMEELVDTLYGKNGANLDLEKIFAIQDLITTIINLSDQQQQKVALQVIQNLQETINNVSEFKKIITTYLIKYLQKFVETKSKDQEKEEAKDLQRSNEETLKIAKKIIDYMHIEQENIFTNEKSKHIFLHVIERRSHGQKNHQLPSLINFWATSAGQQILIHYDVSSPAKIQMFAEMAIDMGAMLLAMQGASLANQQISLQGQAIIAKISKDSQIIQSNMQSFQTRSQANQQKKLQSMITAFSSAQKDIQTKTQQASAISNLELNYLYQNISIDQPQQNYIFNQIQFDQLFSLGTMLTPAGPLWKNPFSVGDWEYEATSNSFWQYQSMPIVNQSTDDAGNKTSSSLQAENNAIYAEYFTTSPSYTIAGTISLQSVSFPFFAGIIFNKSRWISGDFEAIRKCRMIGIYGASNTDVGVYFAQQYTMNDAQLKANPNDDPIQTPLQQIINHKVSKKIDLPATSFTKLQNGPITFNYEITNSPTKVDFKLWTGNNTPITISMSNLDPAIYMYHGIGFICPSAVAQFTLTQPQDFIFTTQAISNYKE